jgi:Asp-tRNA(Asn)/Glu-tRNA(Gln) amidotransferase A subunit family amidase
MAGADLDLCYLTATEALERFRTRSLSPVELMEAVITRAETVNPRLNAITYDDQYRKINGAWYASRMQVNVHFITPYEDGWVKTPMIEG